MIALLTTIHILSAVVLILVVLMQSGKSADLAGAFGGGGSQTTFGPRGAGTLLSRVTTGTAVIFMVTSFTLAIAASRRSSNSVLEGTTSVPVAPQTTPVAPPRALPPVTSGAQPASGAPVTGAARPTISLELQKGGKTVAKTAPTPFNPATGSKDANTKADQKQSKAPEKK